jgi:hypothetical protein
MADVIYNSFKNQLFNAGVNLASDTIMCALVTATYSPDQDLHDFFDDITNEVVVTGYTAGGVALVGKATTQDNVNNRAKWDFTDPYWDIIGGLTARGAIIYKYNANPALAALICYCDFGADQVITTGRFTINLNTVGLLIQN